MPKSTTPPNEPGKRGNRETRRHVQVTPPPVREPQIVRRGLQLAEQPSLKAPETKRQKFQRLSNDRAQKVLLALDNLKKLANRETYDIVPSDVDKVIRRLRSDVDHVEQLLLDRRAPKHEPIRFDE